MTPRKMPSKRPLHCDAKLTLEKDKSVLDNGLKSCSPHLTHIQTYIHIAFSKKSNEYNLLKTWELNSDNSVVYDGVAAEIHKDTNMEES